MLMFEYSADRVDGGGALAGVTGAGYRTLHHNPALLPHDRRKNSQVWRGIKSSVSSSGQAR